MEYLLSQRTYLANLAKGWLASGASAFSVWSDGTPLLFWPEQKPVAYSNLQVPIYYDHHLLGDLRVSGLYGENAQERLNAEAQLISHLIRLEEDMKSMVAELVHSQDQLLAVYQLARSLQYYTTVEDTLRGLLFEAMRLTKTHAGFVVFESGFQNNIIIQYPDKFGDEETIYTIFRQAKSSGKEILLNDKNILVSYSDDADAVMFIPIRVRGSFIAGLGLVHKYNGFTTPDIKLAQAIIDQAIVHIEQVLLQQETVEQRKIQRELELARRVQFRLLPQQLPVVLGLDIAAQSRPARQIGGDFYDFISSPNRPFMFAVGDVSGKALSAALLMTMTRTAIHSKASYMPNPEPELVMRNSNEDLFEDFVQVAMFATAFIGQYNQKNRELIYANAGHSPVIYCPAGGVPRLLNADGPPLGVFKSSVCKNHTVHIGVGDILIIGTDGMNEARGLSEELFGCERLLDLVSSSSHLRADAILELLYASIDAFSAGRLQDDDQTVVVIKGVSE